MLSKVCVYTLPQNQCRIPRGRTFREQLIAILKLNVKHSKYKSGIIFFDEQKTAGDLVSKDLACQKRGIQISAKRGPASDSSSRQIANLSNLV